MSERVSEWVGGWCVVLLALTLTLTLTHSHSALGSSLTSFAFGCAVGTHSLKWSLVRSFVRCSFVCSLVRSFVCLLDVHSFGRSVGGLLCSLSCWCVGVLFLCVLAVVGDVCCGCGALVLLSPMWSRHSTSDSFGSGFCGAATIDY